MTVIYQTQGMPSDAERLAEASQCRECCGKGWNDAWKKVAGHYMGGEVFREECEHCEGAGKMKEEMQA